MTEHIEQLKAYQWERKHHLFRREAQVDASAYQKSGMSDFLRTAVRLKAALEAETPVLLPGEIIAFTRTVPNLPMIFTDEEWAEIASKHFIHEKGNVTNLSPDYGRLIGTGLLALRDRLTDSPYHQAMRISIDAVLDLTRRYAHLAEQQGDAALAAVLRRVPAYPARTFREALQSLRILHFAMWCEGEYHNTLGRLDQYLYPYLENDTLSDAEALELLEAFFLSCNRDSDLYVGMQQGDNGQSIVLGGVKPDGSDAYNRLSFLCLDASAGLRLIDPKINLRVSKDTPLSVFEHGTRLTKLGLGFPQYENDDVAIPALVDLGYDLADARNYAMAACWEFIIPNRAMEIPNIGALPFANLTDKVIREKLATAQSMDSLLDALKAEIEQSVRATAASIHDLYMIPSPYLSLFFDGCLENGLDISLGNRYNNFGLHGTGLATAADMLSAVEEIVFTQKQPPEALLRAMDANFEGHDALHEELINHCPKMGNNDDRADKYAVKLLSLFADAVEPLRNERGGRYRAGTGSAMFYIFHANDLGATADGRKAGTPLPANYAPSLNVRLNGPLSLIQSFAKPDLGRAINGGPLTIEFSNTVFRSDEAITKVAQLVKSFVMLGGHQLQLNTVNRERMLDAQKHPENHRDLIVRVWGWSGYFVELDKCYQDHIIARGAERLMNGVVFDIKEFAVFDGPGIRTTVFLKGCPLRCQWCHNPEGLSSKPQRLGERIAGETWTGEALARRLLKDRAILEASDGGVTFSGGEPLLQWPFVREVIQHLDGLHTCIETSGYASDDVFRDMMEHIDLIMMDVKLVNAQAHKRWTGADNACILRHARMLCEGRKPFIIRVPLIPGVNDTAEHMRDVAQLVQGAPSLQRVELLPYHHTAGAKYPLVGMAYPMRIDADQKVQVHTAPLDAAGIAWKVL